MGIFRQLIDAKTLRILDFLLKNKEKYSHLSEISSQSKVPVASVFRIVNQLVSLGIIEVMPIGKMKIYRIFSNEQTRELENILTQKSKQKNETQ